VVESPEEPSFPGEFGTRGYFVVNLGLFFLLQLELLVELKLLLLPQSHFNKPLFLPFNFFLS
jgi:hypothetical protein